MNSWQAFNFGSIPQGPIIIPEHVKKDMHK